MCFKTLYNRSTLSIFSNLRWHPASKHVAIYQHRATFYYNWQHLVTPRLQNMLWTSYETFADVVIVGLLYGVDGTAFSTGARPNKNKRCFFVRLRIIPHPTYCLCCNRAGGTARDSTYRSITWSRPTSLPPLTSLPRYAKAHPQTPIFQ